MVTQAVASVEVSPSVAELTAWGETVQLTAEALDANGHTVAGAVLSWESTDVLVAAVDTMGLVSGIGEGVVTITASAGAASRVRNSNGSAHVHFIWDGKWTAGETGQRLRAPSCGSKTANGNPWSSAPTGATAS